MTRDRVHGPVQFLLAATTSDLVAPAYGSHTLRAHFEEAHRRG